MKKESVIAILIAMVCIPVLTGCKKSCVYAEVGSDTLSTKEYHTAKEMDDYFMCQNKRILSIDDTFYVCGYVVCDNEEYDYAQMLSYRYLYIADEPGRVRSKMFEDDAFYILCSDNSFLRQYSKDQIIYMKGYLLYEGTHCAGEGDCCCYWPYLYALQISESEIEI